MPNENPSDPVTNPTTANPNPAWMVWTGRVLSVLPALMLLMSAAMKFMQPPEVVKGFEQFGLPLNLAFGLGVLEVACTLLYLIPQTAILGAILLTGYLGGAICTHLRVGDSFIPPLVIGVVIWLGLFLRDHRLRALIPFRRLK
ncbi:DoxX family protein [Planctomicrobium piriforme]|uniref:DoxX-like family protein n=1 Tax=Planctomicrobium piriforme TaxID=1576369 RepID=A0A1I3LNV7_9PLAN|nr:DoxX family protein [Planctomicrobium piriforme]SFI86397.1 DoxX-like family protein [Planctomicrobium piriforme]